MRTPGAASIAVHVCWRAHSLTGSGLVVVWCCWFQAQDDGEQLRSVLRHTRFAGGHAAGHGLVRTAVAVLIAPLCASGLRTARAEPAY